jgi:organic hydroperoxide reductase OsmC/OhrA
MNTQTSSRSIMLNGINTEALRGAISAVAKNPAKGITHWQVASHWRGGTRSDTEVSGYAIGGQRVARDFTIRIDEPLELNGTNKYANPQEYLLAALNACVIVTYVSYCSLNGIALEDLRVETEGDIDLRGLFSLDPSVKAGYRQLRLTVFVKDGTSAQFEEMHRTVMATSPNFFNLANAVEMNPRLVVEQESLRQAA